MKCTVEYVWLDGYQQQNLRSKTKVVDFGSSNLNANLELLGRLPEWGFDGSSTKQAEGSFSECLLKPVSLYTDPFKENGYITFCEVLNADGTPHPTNRRHLIDYDSSDYWFGFEQEYFLQNPNGRMVGWGTEEPKPQGEYYCGVGNENIAGRAVCDEHLELCIKAGLDITGTNAEVALGQWEYQILSKGAKRAGDDLWVSRYLLHRIGEKYGVSINIDPKPIEGDWNGSGLHCNFSNNVMRESGERDNFISILDLLEKRHQGDIYFYGHGNEKRLTGDHETQHIDTFSWGVADRGASIRVPVKVKEDGYKGYLEDRRPGSNANPYEVSRILSEVMSTVETLPSESEEWEGLDMETLTLEAKKVGLI